MATGGVPVIHGHDDDHDGYAGPVLVVTEGGQWPGTAVLRGFFQPVSGRYEWYGRVVADDGEVDDLPGGKHAAVIVTGQGQSRCTLSDRDLWGRLKVVGVGPAPFELDHRIDASGAHS